MILMPKWGKHVFIGVPEAMQHILIFNGLRSSSATRRSCRRVRCTRSSLTGHKWWFGPSNSRRRVRNWRSYSPKTLMPQLDRRITLHVAGAATRDELTGDPVRGAVVDFEVWASRETIETTEDHSTIEGLSRTERIVRFILRWSAELATTPPHRMGITDGLGRVYNVQSVTDSDERRRFVEVEAINAVGDDLTMADIR